MISDEPWPTTSVECIQGVRHDKAFRSACMGKRGSVCKSLGIHRNDVMIPSKDVSGIPHKRLFVITHERNTLQVSAVRRRAHRDGSGLTSQCIFRDQFLTDDQLKNDSLAFT